VRAELVKNKHMAPVWLSSVDETLCEGLPTLSDAAMQVKLARGNCLFVCVYNNSTPMLLQHHR
jgi:hypothetical protein